MIRVTQQPYSPIGLNAPRAGSGLAVNLRLDQFHEAVLRAELDAGCIGFLAVFLHRPTTKKFCTDIE